MIDKIVVRIEEIAEIAQDFKQFIPKSIPKKFRP